VRPSARRITTASALTAAAVILPCAAWYLAGSSDVAREAARLERTAFDLADERADLLSMRTATGLENLRQAEAGCPYVHYQHSGDAGTIECDCPSLVPPHVSNDNANLLLARFQIDADNVLHISPAGDIGYGDRESIRSDLQDLAPAAEALVCSLDEPPYLTEILEGNGTWEEVETGRDYGKSVPNVLDENLLVQGPFVWRTVSLDGIPTLVALRSVLTTSRSIVQGFVVSHDALEERSAGDAGSSLLVHGYATQPGESDIPIPGTAWHLVVDPAPALLDSSNQAKAISSRFHRTFAAGAMMALLAGSCLLWLVFQSERLSRLKARFSAAAAHELRSPLATIRLHSEMLAGNLGRPELVREYAGRMADELERLGRVVDNTLEYARLEDGRLDVHCEIGDLAATVYRSLEVLRPGLESTGACLELSVEDGLSPAIFDPEAIHHVIQNLVDNAEKYSRDSDDRTIRVEIASRDGDVLLTVTDSGPGIPAAERSRLFRPFTGSGGDDANAGLGLGLVLVHALVRAMKGSVTYQDAPGGGARFSVHLRGDDTLILDTPD